jgi:hypothetical protein
MLLTAPPSPPPALAQAHNRPATHRDTGIRMVVPSPTPPNANAIGGRAQLPFVPRVNPTPHSNTGTELPTASQRYWEFVGKPNSFNRCCTPHSNYHLAINTGFPNAYDRAKRTIRFGPDDPRRLRLGRLLRHDRGTDRRDLFAGAQGSMKPCENTRTHFGCAPPHSSGTLEQRPVFRRRLTSPHNLSGSGITARARKPSPRPRRVPLRLTVS